MASTGATAPVSNRQRRKPGPETPPNWQDTYLVEYRKCGGAWLAAERAGISPRTAQRERERNPAFNEACEIAKETKLDALEDKLETLADRTGNPLGIFGRLKAGRPETWDERQRILNINVDLTPPPDQVQAVLSTLLGRVTPATYAFLAPPNALTVGQEAGSGIHASSTPPQESPAVTPPQ